MDRPKIHIVNEYGDDLRPHSTTFIRLIRPLTHPQCEPYLDTTFDLRYRGNPVDLVIVDRLWRPDVSLDLVKVLVNEIRMAEAKFIYSLDDNFFDLVMENKGWPPIEFLPIVEYLLLQADGVFVTTHKLKNRFQSFNANITVLPNVLDERLLVRRIPSEDYSRNSSRRIVIGYMGTLTHDEDLMMVLSAIEEVCERYPNKIEFQVIGAIRKDETKESLRNIPVRYVTPRPHENEYPLFMLWFTGRINWDITISPLRDTPFNHSKSDIKFLDTCAIGSSGIFSNVASYKSTVQHMETGWLADNDKEAWIEALERLISDEDLRISMARNASRYLYSERILAHRGPNWLKAINKSLGLVNHSPSEIKGGVQENR
jgi:glycosyltransferase involved in cell wall biosynthesis